MFLSKLLLDRRRWDVIADLEDRDRLHKKIMRLFPEIPGGPCENARQRLGALYRVENTTILLQSNEAPKMPRGLFGYDLVGTKDVTSNFDALRPERQYRFRLDANTSVQIVDGDAPDWIPEAEDGGVKVRQKTRRVGCGTWSARSRWFEKMCDRCGITPGSYFMESLTPMKVRDGRLEATRFDGLLAIEDLKAFKSALLGGIGQGKSYGLGLVSLRNS